MRIPLLMILPALANAMIRGLSMFGIETEYQNFMCTWSHPIEWHIDKVKSLNFTHIRVPFCYDYIMYGDWSALDRFFDATDKQGLKVTLDFHRLENTHQSAKPYNEHVSFDQFLDAWHIILSRYVNRPSLEAVDCFNEYQSDNYVEWNSLARQIVSSIEHDFPHRFIFYVGGTNWGGNLQFVDLSDMPCADRIYYTIHKYWFSDQQEPIEHAWDVSFGQHKIVANVGEWGFMSDQPHQVDWANRFVNWLLSKNIRDSYFWCWSFNSGDTGGVLKEDCTTVDELKMSVLHKYWGYY